VRRLRYWAGGLRSEDEQLPDAWRSSDFDSGVAPHLVAARHAFPEGGKARKRAAFAPRQAAPQAPSAEPAQTRR
jgi:hypothetical protein